MDIKKTTSGLLILTQLLPVWHPLAHAALPTPSLTTDSQNNTENRFSVATMATGAALQADDQSGALKNLALGHFSGAANSEVQAWLSQFGTARVQLNVDTKGNLGNSALDFLLPLYDGPKNILFAQLGYRAPEGRQTGNLGLGWRTLYGSWMYGANLFLDNDFTGSNRRAGFGAEAWTDYLKLSANSYFGLTGWHQSRDFANYDERPADGWDIRAEAWLPDYPQLGGRLVYEQYRGSHVALVDKNNRQNNPRAITAGLSWTPVPLLTTGVDYQTGSGISDTRFSLMLRYQPGVSLREQLNPDAVRIMRSLAGSRHDLVERNNAIVLDYRKQEMITLALPARQSGNAGETIALDAIVTAKYGVKRVEWDAPELLAAGGKINVTGTTTATVVLPPWQSGNNTWPIRAVAWDNQDNKSNRASTEVTVNPPVATIQGSDLIVTRDNALADGAAANAVKAKVTDGNGNPLAGQTVNFSASNGAKIVTRSGTTDADGVVETTLTSTLPGSTIVTASLASGAATSVKTTFTSSTSAMMNNMMVTRNNALADGNSANAVQVEVTDGNGNALAGESVTFTANKGAQVTTVTGTTGADGLAWATLTNTAAGTTTVTAALSNGTTTSVDTHFTPVISYIVSSMTVTRNNALADGSDKNSVRIVVTDNNGKPQAGQNVTITANNGAVASASTVTTDSNGAVTVDLTNIQDGPSTVTATLDNGTRRQVDVEFESRVARAQVNLMTTKDNALRDGVDQDEVEATVLDIKGNPIAGVNITFKTQDTLSQVLGTQATTNANGKARTEVVSLAAIKNTVIASLDNGNEATSPVNFLMLQSMFRMITDYSPANGVDQNVFAVKLIRPDNGQPVAGQTLTLSTTDPMTLSTTQTTTDANGTATISATSTVASGTAGFSVRVSNVACCSITYDGIHFN
ncbi:inverse autotransporter beta domain-containing protein [Kosakonia sp. H7A]|uniref:inverse autotransporter beta domain-containing protein n=1 Tax=Kosakonia sp. H7A TaxID=2054598 RepID=UPI0013048A21|nr:inverse autotransporter beta domain-containing protein [Kosakonia sp. H7A]